MITMQLEQRLTKQQILEMYCNQIDLGYRGSFRSADSAKPARAVRQRSEVAHRARGRDAGRHGARGQLL